MLAVLKQMFEAHQEEGTVVIEHDTKLAYGQLVK
jgi:hypothetical protein